MIPKVIHYCWFGGKPLPPLAEKCIASWRKYLPDYEIKRWDESNFNVNIIPYTAQAYEAKKYAFVSDYARFWILYKYGGLYFDTDVEVIKPMDEIIGAGPFMGCEKTYQTGMKPNELGVAPGLGLGVSPANDLYRQLLELYTSQSFSMEGDLNVKTVVDYTTELLCQYGLKATSSIQKVRDIIIYPAQFFSPKSFATGKITLTPDTVCIHHFAMSWMSKRAQNGMRIERLLRTICGDKVIKLLHIIYYAILNIGKKVNSIN